MAEILLKLALNINQSINQSSPKTQTEILLKAALKLHNPNPKNQTLQSTTKSKFGACGFGEDWHEMWNA